MSLDMWYKNSPKEATRIDCFWSDTGCFYHGNIYIGEKCVGDYMASDLEQLDRWFPQLNVWKN